MEETDIRNLEALLRQQESLRAVIESISHELALRPLLTRIVRHACELIGADDGTIGLVDPERRIVRTEAVYNMPPNELGSEVAEGVGLAGQVLRTGEPIVLERYGDLERPTQPDLLEHAVVGVPILWREAMTGFFGIGARPPRRFNERDIDVLSLYARHAAIAIENAQRYERERRRTERFALIARIGSIIAVDLRLEDLLQNAADAIHERLGYPNVAIPLVSDDPEVLVLRYFGGHYKTLMPEEYRLPIAQGIMGAAVRERVPVLVNDVSHDPRYFPTPGAVGITAELAVPILLGDRALGVLNVESGTPFDEEDAASLQIVAVQLAVAIENARLFTGKQQALDEMQLLYQASQRIGTATGVDDVVRAYLEQVAGPGRFACTVVLYEQSRDGGRNAVSRGQWTASDGIEIREQALPAAIGTLEASFSGGRTIVMASARSGRRIPAELRAFAETQGWESLALIPLQARGQRIGFVALGRSEPQEWREEDLQRYQTTAAQLAMAIDQHRQQRLVYERGQQLAVLEERQRLARELHDSVTQLVFSATLIAQTLAPVWKRDPAEGERRIQRLLDLSRSALSEMRDLLQELRPAGPPVVTLPQPPAPETGIPTIGQLRREGLAASLTAQAADACRDGRKVTIDAAGYRSQPIGSEEALFRITQEALSNAARHAQAHQVRIVLQSGAEGTRLTITDDGIGFEASTRGAGGLGLITMRERAEALGGTFRIASSSGRGTVIDVTVPDAGYNSGHGK